MPEPDTFPLSDLTADGFRALAHRLDPAPAGGALPAFFDRPVGPSDFDLNAANGEHVAELATDAQLRFAAVLVPVIARPELTLLFTQRTAHLPAHAGQIAFPGGTIDASDPSPLAAALREAEEEIGLDRALVEPLGALDCYRTGTGYCIAPIVALVDPAFSLVINPEEVVDTFEVPLPFLMNPRNHQTYVRTLGGRERSFYAMPYRDRFIWGATAGMLKNMQERLFGS